MWEGKGQREIQLAGSSGQKPEVGDQRSEVSRLRLMASARQGGQRTAGRRQKTEILLWERLSAAIGTTFTI